MNKSLVGLVFLGLFSLLACNNDRLNDPYDRQIEESLNRVSPTGSYKYYQFPEVGDYAAIPHQDPHNIITADKAELGKLLFHETGLAVDAAYPVGRGSYSCASCHVASAGFTPGRFQGVADGAVGVGENRRKLDIYTGTEVDAQGARPLSVLNVAYVTNMLWSGIFGGSGVNEGTEAWWSFNPAAEINFEGLEGMESQNIESLHLHRMSLSDELLDVYGYRELFDRCFPEYPEAERYTDETVAFALGAYLRTVLANEAPFQDWLKGDKTAMTASEKRGALLFLNEARCTNCHKGPSFNAMEFHAIGASDLHEFDAVLNTSEDDRRSLGRAFFSGRTEDENCFKVPQLYNLKDYTHYFHGSSKTTLREVIEYKMAAQSENPRVGPEHLSDLFKPVDLSQQQVNDLLDFLENALRDDNLERYVPESLPSGNCFPNNDLFSRIELGCD
ncbi:MAG: cytochrome-c peroxidase [Bacteroidota bacterium]